MPGGIGILGGTFDPVHLAHLRVAEELFEAERLDELRFVPCAVPPHKARADVADAAHRLRMVELAIAGRPAFRAWDVELGRAGPSYSVDTLRALRGEVGADGRIVFALGRDAFEELHTWKEYATIFDLCDVVVLTRPPHVTPLASTDFPVATREAFGYDPPSAAFRHVSGHRVTLLRVTHLDISATDVRARVRTGRSIRYLVPDPVSAYVQAHGLYGPSRRIPQVE
ncbi:MAG: nicotinate-nucleotide adenylyltransferase [Candidatus Binatia bacterium]